MKKDYTLKIMLGLLLVISNVVLLAQQTIQIGTDTVLPANTLYSPVYRFSAGSSTTLAKSNILFTAAELASAGLPNGAIITSIEFYKGNNATFLVPASHKVYMANTTNTALSTTTTWASILASHTEVFSDANFNVPAVTGWVVWNVNPFIYNGDALEIATELAMTGANGADNNFPWQYTPSTPTDLIIGVTGTGTTLNGTVAAYKHRPNIKINYLSPVPCTDPPTAGSVTSSVSASVCPGTNISLNINGGSFGIGQTYQWESSTTLNGTYSTVGTPQAYPLISVAPMVTTYYRAAITCGSSTVYTDTLEVLITPPFPGGTYTINSAMATGGTNFQTFAEAINALECGIAGPITFDVIANSGPYVEQIIIPEVAGASAMNTITFNGNGNTIEYHTGLTGQRAVIKLDGADYITINNLVIKSITGTYGWGIHVTNSANNNSITNNTIIIDSTSTSSTNYAPIVVSNSTSSLTSTGDNAKNLVISGNILSGGYNGISLIGVSSDLSTGNQITNNNIQNFYNYGILIEQNDGALISGNNISRPTRTNSTTYAGITLGSGINTIIEKNIIHHLMAGNTTGTSSGYGIYFNGVDAPAGSENKAINNVIYSFGGNGTVYGIYNSSSDSTFIFHNTISFDDETSTGGTTRGFYQTTTATGIVFKNNNISITRGGSGVKHAIYLNTSTSVIESNYNNLYVNSQGSGSQYIGYHSSTQYSTLSDWKTANSGAYDQNSKSVNPIYVDPSTGNYTPGNALLNNYAPNVGVNIDILGTARGTNTDPGAYEFTPPPDDAGIHLILNPVAPLGIGNQDVIVSIRNFGTTTLTSANVYAEIYDGTSTTLLGPVAFTGSLAPGIISSPIIIGNFNFNGGDFTIKAWTTDPNAAVDVNNINDTVEISLCTGISGLFTINPLQVTGGTNFASFSELNNVLTSCGVIGSVTVDVLAGGQAITEQVTFGQIPGASALNTITINGNGDTLKFDPTTSQRFVLQISGSEFLIIDSLYIKSTNATYGYGILLSNGARNITIKNSTIDILDVTSSTASNSGGIIASAAMNSNTSTGENVISSTFIGNTILGGYYGIRLNGSSTASGADNNIIDNNLIQDFYAYGVYLNNADSNNIMANDITRPTRTSVGTFYGIYVTNSMNNMIFKNEIHNTHGSATTQSGSAYGVYITSADATVGSENKVYNNIIHDFNSTTGLINALYNSGSDGALYYHNTIVLDHQSATDGITRGFYQTTSATNIKIKNNIFFITRSGTGEKQAFYFNTDVAGIESDYNNLFVYSPSSTISGVTFYGSNHEQLNQWQNSNGGIFDQNSYAVDPLWGVAFMPNAGALDNSGSDVGISTDFYGTLRSVTPDIGAVEFTSSGAVDMAFSGFVEPSIDNICGIPAQGISVLITNNSSSAVSNIPVVVNITGAISTSLTGTLTGPLQVGETDTLVMGTINTTSGGNFNLQGYVSYSNDVSALDDTVSAAFSFNAVPAAPIAINDTACLGDVFTLAVQNNGLEYYWYDVPVGGTALDTGNIFTTPALTTSTSYYVEAQNLVSENVGIVNGGTSSFISTLAYGLFFTTTGASTTINHVHVYPTGTGTITIHVADLANNILFSSPTASISGTGSQKIQIPVNITLPAGDYKMLMSYTGITNLIRESGTASYPYISPSGAVAITAGAIGGTSSSSSSYYWFYDWGVSSKGCLSDRTEVKAIISVPNADAGTDVVTCSNTEVTLGGTPVASNGFAPYNYSWSPVIGLSSTSVSNPNAMPGLPVVYTVTVTDKFGCTATDVVSLDTLSAPDATITLVGIQCFNGDPIQLVAATGGGTWSGTGISSFGEFSPVAAGSGVHSITYMVTNSTNNCFATDTLNVEVTTAIISTVDSIVATQNSSTSNGAIYINITGGVAPYSFNWSNNATTEDISGLATGNYTVTITDDAGCEITEVYYVDTLSGIGIVNIVDEVVLNLYPVPASDYLTIEIKGSNSGNASLEIIDLLGRTVERKEYYLVDSLNDKLDISSLVEGSYKVRLTINNIVTIKGIVIVR